MKLIIAGFFSISAAAIVFIALIVYPGYKSTSSRLYPTPLGYPAMLRFLDRPIPVEAGKAEPAPILQTMMGQGFLSPHELLSISTRTPNLVSKVLVQVGAQVHQGQLLIELDPDYAMSSVKKAEANLRIAEINLSKLKAGSRPEIVREKDATLSKAKGDLKTAKQQLQREQRLFDQGAIPREELETYESKYRVSLAGYTTALEDVTIAQHSTTDDIHQSEAKVESARAELAARRKDLRDTKIYAPSDGIVTSRSINPGEITRGSTQQLLAIADGLEFQVLMDQQYFGNLHIGQDATVFLDAYSGRTFQGPVIRIDPAVQGAATKAGVPDQQAPTFAAWIALKDLQPGVSLAPGMQGYARIVAHRQALAVPSGAVIDFSGGEGLVLAVRKSRVVVQPVRFGVTSDRRTEILAGLKPGDVIVLSGQSGLEPNDKVSVQEHKSR